jgi:endonuclease III
MTDNRKYTKSQQEQRIVRILEAFDAAYPDARCALEHRTPLELLIATILSAQCTDQRVNIVTRTLFQKYRNAADYANAPRDILEEDIRSTGFYRNKAKSLQECCRMIVEQFQGNVPESMELLVTLPGVARKTANVVLGVAFGKADGLVVDTHVHRISRRLGLTSETTPEKIEADLMRLVPHDRWISFAHQVIQHGRQICVARKPLCSSCPVESVCQSEDKVPAVTSKKIPKSPGRR